MTDTETGADASLDEEQNALNEPEETEVESEETGQEETSQESEAESPPADEENVDEKNPIQDRIDTLTRRYREEERRRQALEQELEELRKGVSERPKEEPLKTLADFDYDNEKYLEYRLDVAEKRAQEAARQAASRYEQETREERVFRAFTEREKDFAKDKGDYHEVVTDPTLRISPTMASEIRESDIGPEMAYHLGKNPDVAAEIASLPERAAIRRMVQLESKLKSEKSKQAAKVSKAPPPPKKIKGSNAQIPVPPTDPKSDELSDDEWFKAEEKRLAKLRG